MLSNFQQKRTHTNEQFVLYKTGYKQLIHIGHSEGTMQGFAGYQNPEVVRVSHMLILASLRSLLNLSS